MPRPKKQPATDGSAQAPTPAPQPSPAVLSLQQDIVNFVRKRDELSQLAAVAQAKLYTVQAEVQACHAELQRAEQTIQYRIGLIAQLENRAPLAPVISMPAPQIIGVSATPTQAEVQAKQNAEDMVSRGHANRDPNALVSRMM